MMFGNLTGHSKDVNLNMDYEKEQRSRKREQLSKK